MNQTTEPELEELSVSELVVEILDRVSGARRNVNHGIDKGRIRICAELLEATKALKELQTRTG